MLLKPALTLALMAALSPHAAKDAPQDAPWPAALLQTLHVRMFDALGQVDRDLRANKDAR